MATVLDFLTDVGVDIGALSQGETFNNDEAQYLFRQFNRMIGEFNTDRTNLFTQQELILALSAKASYSIGPGASDFPGSPRPSRIDQCYFQHPGTTIRRKIKIVNEAEWSDIPERGRSGALIDVLYNDFGFPFSTFSVSPIPTGTPSISMFVWSVISQFVTLSDAFSLPDGYDQAYLKSLGVRVANSFHSPLVDQTYIAAAVQARTSLRTLNAMLFENSAIESATAPGPGAAPPQTQPPQAQ